MERISTGVAGLDKLIEGGLPKGSITLVSGAPGTGKTIMGMQFLEAGLKKGEKCVYVTIEEPPEKILDQARQFGFFAKPPAMISARDIKYDIALTKPNDLLSKINLIMEKLEKEKPDRVLVDSVSSLIIEDGSEARVSVRKLVEGLNKLGATSILTSELSKESEWFSRDTVSEFLSDGIIKLEMEIMGKEVQRSLVLIKIRGTKIEGGRYSIEIKNKGIKIVD